mmetsp:Transcript_48114/g.114334  ORF Transcript_48114/g.114334 Transcript_48114/m.114334 type:complete len:320 (-) Transcript_48114:57-1016(-)
MGCNGSKAGSVEMPAAAEKLKFKAKDAAAVALMLGLPALKGALEKMPIVGAVLGALEAAQEAWSQQSAIKLQLECLQDCCVLLLKTVLPELRLQVQQEILKRWLERVQTAVTSSSSMADLVSRSISPKDYADELDTLGNCLNRVATCILKATTDVAGQDTKESGSQEVPEGDGAVAAAGTTSVEQVALSLPGGDDKKLEDIDWLLLAESEEGQRMVDGQRVSRKHCLERALGCNPRLPNAWNSLGFEGGGTIKGVNFSEIHCYETALRYDAKYVPAWFNLGYAGGGTVEGVKYSKMDCYKTALQYNPRANPSRAVGIVI